MLILCMLHALYNVVIIIFMDTNDFNNDEY